ncbi:EAL domain-containing protein [Rhodoferax sp.]|uniref:EAL domain-containing protein n=1 Tax=Rhodoferax sp. TaxID=50421 RepID=UPI0030177AE3
MKLFNWIASSMASHANLFRIGVAALTACTVVVLFTLTQPVNLIRHNILVNNFGHLQSDESRLGEAVLQLNFSLSNNYDQVTTIMGRMNDTARELRQGEAASLLREDNEFQQQLLLLEQRIASQTEALEQFKSRNAVLKNSLIYLPHARDDLLKDLSRESMTHEHVNDLVEKVLLNRIKGALLERGNLDATVNGLQNETANLPSSTLKKLGQLLRHVHQIDQVERDLPGLVRQLTSHSDNSGLGDAYRHFYDQQQRRATVYRIFLLLATLGLFAYAVRSFIRMGEQSRRLKLAASVFSTASEGITITDTRGIILDVNAAFTQVTGYSPEEVIGKNPRTLQSGRHDAQFYATMWQSIKGTGQWQGEIWNRRKNGDIYPEWLTITAATDQNDTTQKITHYVATFSDITQRKKNEADIHQLAFHDPLTDLPNRRLLMDRLNHTLALRGQSGGKTSLLFINIDNFKSLNDLKGHDIGNQLLIETAKRLKTCAREGDTVSRLGSDEFVVMLESLSGVPEQAAAQAKVAAEKIQKALNLPYWLTDFEHQSSCSIGISLSSPLVKAEELLQHANTAMSEAKAAGRDALRFFDPTMQSALEAHARLEADLRLALMHQQFVLYYQIQVNADQKAIGAEALVRWNHPENGLISPAIFIPLAEATGLIVPLGQWVLETACAQLKAWEANAHTRDLVLAVNVSARQFSAEGFVTLVESLLLSNGITPSRLKLEITESMLLGQVEDVISTMRQLKALGVSFSMDDFGTGYSSLQYLKRLPLDQIKIDQSFVRDITTDSSDQAIVGTIVAMAQSMNLSIIAEGVETELQREMLATKGCANFQGYLFSRPVPIEAFEALLAQR